MLRVPTYPFVTAQDRANIEAAKNLLADFHREGPEPPNPQVVPDLTEQEVAYMPMDRLNAVVLQLGLDRDVIMHVRRRVRVR